LAHDLAAEDKFSCHGNQRGRREKGEACQQIVTYSFKKTVLQTL